MSTGSDRLYALCPPELHADLDSLSPTQVATLRKHINTAISDAKRRLCHKRGRPIASTHPRASYWREYKRRKAAEKRSRQGRMTA